MKSQSMFLSPIALAIHFPHKQAQILRSVGQMQLLPCVPPIPFL